MKFLSTSLSESNPLSNLGFDELLALADSAWAHSTSLPGNDDGVKSLNHHHLSYESSQDPQGCVHLSVHFFGKRGGTSPLLNVDPDRYSYINLVDDIHRLAMADGCDYTYSPFTIYFSHPGSQSKNPINTDSDVLDMFKLNVKCVCINVYATILSFEDSEFGVGNFDEVIRTDNHEVVIREFDDEWRIDEPQKAEGEETDSGLSYVVQEERQNENNNDEMSDYEENYDLISYDSSDKDKSMKGNFFAHDLDGKVKLEVGLLFIDVNEFREALRHFVIQEGFKIKRIKNERTKVIAICAAAGCSWRIYASPTLDGKTYKIKTYNHVHSCMRAFKNSNAAGKVKFEAGLLFKDVNEFRAALTDFVFLEGFQIKKIRNEKTRVTAICAAYGCPWRVYASPTPDGKFKIRVYNNVHSCIRTSKNSNTTSTRIAEKLESKLKDDTIINRKRGLTEGPAGSHEARGSSTVECGNC